MKEQDHRKVPRAHSPLSVISLFFGLVEAGFAYSAGVSSGAVQIGVLIFMALFAVGIAGTFFTFLWKRNWVFYPPSDFPSASVESYVAAMRGGTDLKLSRLTDSVGLVFDDDSLPEKLNHAVMLPEPERGETIRQIIKELRRNAVEEIEASALRFDARPLMGKAAPVWEEIYNEDTPVDSWLNRVAWRLEPFPPYPYGTIWLLKDASSGKIYDDIGTTWAKKQGMGQDNRLLSEVGIRGGMNFEVIEKRA